MYWRNQNGANDYFSYLAAYHLNYFVNYTTKPAIALLRWIITN